VSFVGAGTCTLTAHVAAGTNFGAADGTAQSFVVGQATPTAPSISNIPVGAIFGGNFAASVSTNGDGTETVTSSTTGVCTVGGDGLTVGFVGVGTCTLTAHVAAGTDFGAADGTEQSFTIGQATPTAPSISNLPASPAVGDSFVANVSTTGDGLKSVTSSTSAACTVGGDGLTVSFVGTGTCSLTAHVAAGTNFTAADGSAQSVTVVPPPQAATATSVAVHPGTPALNQLITFTVTVTDTPSPGTSPTGSVSLFVDGSGTPAVTLPLASGQATYTTVLPAGPHTVSASYGGGTAFLASTSTLTNFTVGAPNATVVTGSSGTVTVPPGGTVIVDNASISGGISVGAGGTLDLESSTVSGSLNANGAATIRVCGSSVGGSVVISGTTGFVLLGDTGDDGCAGNTFNGSVLLISNHGGLELSGNPFLAGPVNLTGNSGSGPFVPDDNAPEIEANQIHGSLSCSANAAGLSNGGQPNTVGGARSGQCVGF
jgi:hypothetical protein